MKGWCGMKTADNSEMILNIGPDNLLTHGALRLKIKLDGELIKEAEPVMGYLHRGLEKLAESRTYLQYQPMVDTIDYLSGVACQEAYCAAVEELSDIEVPERAKYIRVMLAELDRISSHLFRLGVYAADLGCFSPVFMTFREREMILKIFENICGKRMLCNFHTFGGVKQDLKDSDMDNISEFISIFPKKVKEYQNIVTENPIFKLRTEGLGIITKNKAFSYSLSGVGLRSSGSDLDFRKTNPYLVYDKLEFAVPTEKRGDCYSRCLVRIREMIESLKIIKQCREYLLLNKGDYKNEDVNPLLISPEPNMTVSFVESPRGLLACTIVSDGSGKPFRVKWRTPSFYAIQILPELLKNKYYSDIAAIVGSLDISVSEADR